MANAMQRGYYMHYSLRQ